MATSSQAINKLAKFLTYVLGRRPDEFGLILDENGFTRIKDLLKAMGEENGWKHLRQGHLNELLVSLDPCPIEIQGNLVRASDSSHLPVVKRPEKLPKLLYTAIRRKAYPYIHENGLKPSAYPYVILTSEIEMARRLGRRNDQDPVLLTVQVESAQSKGVQFDQFGELIFLANFVPVGVFSGPPLPKEKPAVSKFILPVQTVPKTPGSYYPDLSSWEEEKSHKNDRRKRKEKDWKKDRRQARKQKAERLGR